MSSLTEKQLSAVWVDDYLDLYNYAGRLGDTAWQHEIIQLLQQRDLIIQAEVQQKLEQDLWKMFDMINQKMLRIYELIRSSEDKQQAQALREQVWELKSQRIDISRKIRKAIIGMSVK